MSKFGLRQGRHGFSLVALIVALAAGDGAAAQDAGGDGTIILDTVTVEGTSTVSDPVGPGVGYGAPTSRAGTKTDTPILETPQSIQVLTRQLIEDTGARSLTDILRHAAGVMPGGYYNGWDYVRIRGFDADTSVFLDGLINDYYVGIATDPLLLERVEVVRGPASTLYGAGSAGGMVNLVSKRPVAENFATVTTMAGTEEDYQATLDAGLVLTPDETLYGRLLVLLGSEDTFIEHVDVSKRIVVAPSLTWKPNAQTSLTLLARYSENWDRAAPTLPARGTVLPNANGKLPLDSNLGEPDYPGKLNLESQRIGYEFRHEFDETFAVRQSARMSWFDSKWSNIIYPAGLGADDRTLMRFYYSQRDKWTVFSVDTAAEARFSTGSLQHFVALGVDYTAYDDERDASDFSVFDFIDIFDPDYGQPSPAQPLTVHTQDDARALGFYVQDQVKISSEVTVTLGGRFDRAKTSSDSATTHVESEDDKFSPKAGITWEFQPGFAAYATYSESFRPQPGKRTASNGNVEPETGVNYEVGLKADSEDGTLGGTLALFDITRQNVASSTDDPRYYAVSGEQRSRGIEVDARWSPAPGLDLTAAYTYTHIRVTEGDNDGATPRNVPAHMYSAWAHYRLQDGPLEGFGFGAGVSHYTKQQGDDGNTFTLPAYTLVDATLSYEAGPYRAQLNVSNLFDEEYYVGSYSDLYVLPGPPTEARLTLGYTF